MKKPFNPDILPLKTIDWESLIEPIGKANRNLAKLDGFLNSIPNAKVFLSPLTTNEAVLSSKIEGTLATLEEVLKFEVKSHINTAKYEDIQEIINYREAMNVATKQLEDGLPISARLIKNIHKVLLTGSRGREKDPGNFRTGSVYIGQQGLGIKGATYVPPEAKTIANHFLNFEKYIHTTEKDFLVQLAIIHAQFEIIYPFWDGNGRTGRILIPLFLYYKKVLDTPMFYISEYLESHRKEYYKRLGNISKNGDWTNWIKFFLLAISEQATKNIKTVKAILSLYEKSKKDIIKIPTPKNAIKVLDFLFSAPFFDTKTFIKEAQIQKVTTQRILKFLVQQGILEHTGEKRSKTYFFMQLINIIK